MTGVKTNPAELENYYPGPVPDHGKLPVRNHFNNTFIAEEYTSSQYV